MVPSKWGSTAAEIEIARTRSRMQSTPCRMQARSNFRSDAKSSSEPGSPRAAVPSRSRIESACSSCRMCWLAISVAGRPRDSSGTAMAARCSACNIPTIRALSDCRSSTTATRSTAIWILMETQCGISGLRVRSNTAASNPPRRIQTMSASRFRAPPPTITRTMKSTTATSPATARSWSALTTA